MSERLPITRAGLAALVLVAAALFLAVGGLARFRRDYARRLAAIGGAADVDLAFGEPWLVALKTAWLALRHPTLLRWGLYYRLYLTFGVDPVALLTDDDLSRIQRTLNGAQRGRDRDPRG